MSKSVNRGLVGNLNPQRKKSTNYSQLVIRKQVLAFLNEHKKSQLVAQLYEETIEKQPMSLEDVVKNLSSKRIEQLFIVYLEKPTIKLWRWSLTFLGVILGLCLFTSLSALRF